MCTLTDYLIQTWELCYIVLTFILSLGFSKLVWPSFFCGTQKKHIWNLMILKHFPLCFTEKRKSYTLWMTCGQVNDDRTFIFGSFHAVLFPVCVYVCSYCTKYPCPSTWEDGLIGLHHYLSCTSAPKVNNSQVSQYLSFISRELQFWCAC